jgi:hypothetical protein
MTDTETELDLRFASPSGRRDLNPRELAHPLPASLVGLIEPQLVEHHAALVDRYGQAMRQAVGAERAVRDAADQDEQAAAKAVELLKPIPRASLPAAEKRLAECQRELRAAETALAASADAILAAAAPRFGQADAELARRRVELLDQAEAELKSAAATLESVAAGDSEADWIGRAISTTAGEPGRRGVRVAPYSPRPLPTEAARRVQHAISAIGEAEAKRLDAAAWRERQRAAEARLPNPPTAPTAPMLREPAEADQG